MLGYRELGHSAISFEEQELTKIQAQLDALFPGATIDLEPTKKVKKPRKPLPIKKILRWLIGVPIFGALPIWATIVFWLHMSTNFDARITYGETWGLILFIIGGFISVTGGLVLFFAIVFLLLYLYKSDEGQSLKDFWDEN